MKRFLFLVILCTAMSCQFFETKKLSKETIYEDELKTIVWSDVDQYPAFKQCKGEIDKQAQKECFTKTLSHSIYDAISINSYVTSQDLQDTILLTMTVDKEGKLLVKNIEMDSVAKSNFPKLDSIVIQNVETLQTVSPAYKRAIPVKTEFKLPLILATSNL